MAKEEKAMAKKEENLPAVLESGAIIRLPSRDGEFERIESKVVIPKDALYNIPKWDPQTRRKVDCWRPDSTAYDLINRVMGVQFDQPDTMVDEHGDVVGNPILKKDYVKLRLAGYWYNNAGLPMKYVEDVEINFWVLFTQKLMRSESSEITNKKTDHSICVDEENSVYIKVSASDYKKAWAFLIEKRAFATRYAYTVAKRRILKTATGVAVVHPKRVGNHDLAVIPVVSYRNLAAGDIKKHAKEMSSKMYKGDKETIESEITIVADQIPTEKSEAAGQRKEEQPKNINQQLEEVFKNASKEDKTKLVKDLIKSTGYDESNLIGSIDKMNPELLLGTYQMLLKKKEKKEKK